jgi:flagellar basal body-associated protein FliL
MSKFCQSCGSSLNDNSKFCTNCGSSVITEPESPVQTVQPSSVFCPGCGLKNEDGVKFCIGCGHNLSSEVQESAPVQPQPQFVAEPQPQFVAEPQPQLVAEPQAADTSNKTSKASLIIPIVAIILILICGVLGAYFLFMYDKDNDDDDSKSSRNSRESSYVESKIESSEDDSSENSSSKNDSSKISSSKEDPINNPSENDLDPYGVFTTSKYNRGYQVAIGSMMYGVQTKDYSLFYGAMPDYYAKALSEIIEEDERDEWMEEVYSEFSQDLGEGYKINCETTSDRQLSASEIQELEDETKDTFDETIKIEEGYCVTVKIIVSNNGETKVSSQDIYCGKISGKWYVLDME